MNSIYYIPVYSGTEAGEEMVEPFSQSFSPFWPLIRLGDMNREGECERLEGKTDTKCIICTFTELKKKK